MKHAMTVLALCQVGTQATAGLASRVTCRPASVSYKESAATAAYHEEIFMTLRDDVSDFRIHAWFDFSR